MPPAFEEWEAGSSAESWGGKWGGKLEELVEMMRKPTQETQACKPRENDSLRSDDMNLKRNSSTQFAQWLGCGLPTLGQAAARLGGRVS